MRGGMTRRGQRSELAEAARARRGAATRREAAEAAPDRRRNAGSPASAPNAGSPASAAQDAGSPAPCATRVPRARHTDDDHHNDVTQHVTIVYDESIGAYRSITVAVDERTGLTSATVSDGDGG